MISDLEFMSPLHAAEHQVQQPRSSATPNLDAAYEAAVCCNGGLGIITVRRRFPRRHEAVNRCRAPKDLALRAVRLQGTWSQEHRHAGPVKCNALFGPARPVTWPCRRAYGTTPQTWLFPLQST